MKDKVVLIGMPGCGKSTIGKLVSEELKLKFFDMDKHIEEISFKTIPELFEKGEDHFRDFETLACKELVQKSNALISSGGGVIKRKENIEILKEKALIIFIDRPLKDLLEDVDTSNRPLLKEGRKRLINLYEERYDLYRASADVIIKNDRDIIEAVDDIKRIIKEQLIINYESIRIEKNV